MTATNVFTQEEIQIFKKTKTICRAVDHKLRRDILDYIYKKGEALVTEIFIYFRIHQAAASQHLAALRKTKFVTTRRDGKNIYYSINKEQIQLYVDLFSEL